MWQHQEHPADASQPKMSDLTALNQISELSPLPGFSAGPPARWLWGPGTHHDHGSGTGHWTECQADLENTLAKKHFCEKKGNKKQQASTSSLLPSFFHAETHNTSTVRENNSGFHSCFRMKERPQIIFPEQQQAGGVVFPLNTMSPVSRTLPTTRESWWEPSPGTGHCQLHRHQSGESQGALGAQLGREGVSTELWCEFTGHCPPCVSSCRSSSTP